MESNCVIKEFPPLLYSVVYFQAEIKKKKGHFFGTHPHYHYPIGDIVKYAMNEDFKVNWQGGIGSVMSDSLNVSESLSEPIRCLSIISHQTKQSPIVSLKWSLFSLPSKFHSLGVFLLNDTVMAQFSYQ